LLLKSYFYRFIKGFNASGKNQHNTRGNPMVAVASAARTQAAAPNLPSHRDPYYAGKWQKPKVDRYIDTISPGTGESLGKVVDGSVADAEAAIAAAKAAFREWRRVLPLERAKMLRDCR